MQMTIHNRHFAQYITRDRIDERLKSMAASIMADHAGKPVSFLVLLNGAFMFAADLVRLAGPDCEVLFAGARSYEGMRSGGTVRETIRPDEELSGRHIVILEDIIDTGRTLEHLLPKIRERNPASLRVAALLFKKEALKFPVTPDYTGFEIPDRFVVGYGMDYNGLGRNLPDIYKLV